ncbi:MAG TPA: hypothetical protein VGK38_07255 [Prolixibacteraceae bacterium]|jgi:hypothetical protein
METINLESDINVLCVTAKSFPDGIMDAFDQLHAIVPADEVGRQFGISRPAQGGTIVYKAAMEEVQEGEAEKLGCEPFVIKRGKYIYLDKTDFMKDLPGIGKTFQMLISQPNIDPNGYCLEWYLNDKDVRCMVRLDDNIH